LNVAACLRDRCHKLTPVLCMNIQALFVCLESISCLHMKFVRLPFGLMHILAKHLTITLTLAISLQSYAYFMCCCCCAALAYAAQSLSSCSP